MERYYYKWYVKFSEKFDEIFLKLREIFPKPKRNFLQN